MKPKSGVSLGISSPYLFPDARKPDGDIGGKGRAAVLGAQRARARAWRDADRRGNSVT